MTKFLCLIELVASANAVNYCNAVPYFVEIEESTLGVNPIKLEKYLKKTVIFKNGKPFNKNTKRKISCLILLHLFGHPSIVDIIKKVTKKFKIPLLEDAAESLGSYYRKKTSRYFGDLVF